MNALAVLPARLGSTRLPRKVLAEIAGKPLIWHVWNRVRQARCFSEVIIAADSEEVQLAMQPFGARVLLTSPECRSGTERIVSLLPELEGDLIVNVQGDEPLIDPRMLEALVESWAARPCDILTPAHPITSAEELRNPNLVKIARAADGRALYFSRSPIPYLRDVPEAEWPARATYWRHIGVYGYRRQVLEAYSSLPDSPLEAMEKLEQLRFLEAGCTIRVLETDYRPVAVDTPEDLEAVRRIFARQEHE